VEKIDSLDEDLSNVCGLCSSINVLVWMLRSTYLFFIYLIAGNGDGIKRKRKPSQKVLESRPGKC